MKYIIASYFFLFCCSIALAQQSFISKPIIDSAAINHWPSLSGTRAISNDGKYFMYSIDNQPVGRNTMIIQSTENSWKKEFVGIATGLFSGDNKEFIFQDADTLFFLSLGKGDIKRIPGVASYNQPLSGKGRWLIYQFNSTQQELVLLDSKTNQEKHFGHVNGYAFDDAMTKILIATDNGLKWTRLKDGKASSIWLLKDHPGLSLGGYTMDKTGSQVGFLTTRVKDSAKVNTIWYYQEGMAEAKEKANDGSEGIEPGLKVAVNPPRFSRDGRFIYFSLINNLQNRKAAPDAVSVDVWNWKDGVLQAAQMADHSQPVYAAAIGAKELRVIRLEYENEQNLTYNVLGDYVVIGKNNNPGDRFWLNKPDSTWLVSVKDGSRTLLDIKAGRYGEYYFSPGGGYMVYYDFGQKGNFFSYDLSTKQMQKISIDVPDSSLSWKDDFELPHEIYGSAGIAGWEAADTSLLVYDNYDIWKLSLNGSHVPVNVTQGYGRTHNIKFRIADERDGPTMIYKNSDSLVLVAFNTTNKYNGFYRQTLSYKSSPVLLSMGPWTIYHGAGMINVNTNEFENAGMAPMKAEYAKSWVVLRTTATEAPNYFLTKDFKNYKRLTNQQPQKNYNWLTSELMSWVQPDGITTQGVLYKPEDFDPRKKYPVIIHYYQQLSHRVYEYPQPKYINDAHINIPWFVSRGYLVFTPDIYYHQFEIGQSATTTVESAGRMLSKLPYVDSLRMGIAGHSYGGAETNYIVTHTHLFAAALSGAAGHLGVDLISNSLACIQGTYNELGRYEQGDLGATLWQRPDIWIKQSPIFQADQVTTPLLIFYNKLDLDWLRALEFFIALRRLEKRVWMLQYDHGGHEVIGKDAEDFTIRITQFFDHYLKDAPMPVWMSRGIPARLKGIDNGLELDTEKTPR